jgi:hypothetical protein
MAASLGLIDRYVGKVFLGESLSALLVDKTVTRRFFGIANQ